MTVTRIIFDPKLETGEDKWNKNQPKLMKYNGLKPTHFYINKLGNQVKCVKHENQYHLVMFFTEKKVPINGFIRVENENGCTVLVKDGGLFELN